MFPDGVLHMILKVEPVGSDTLAREVYARVFAGLHYHVKVDRPNRCFRMFYSLTSTTLTRTLAACSVLLRHWRFCTDVPGMHHARDVQT